ncbi:NUDIX hydrolase [Candidatus Protofrankia californiensis]|uniref:NUDIX hydrolase n=1 Tax=Candidatus Protofrankia californiensis TaxID=1839754 RepID=A0A1C3PGQ7_9ACTN|nr:NUDIX hydrolase [Candidatus Protofrankia californiensis]
MSAPRAGLTVPPHLRPWSAPWPDYTPVDATPEKFRTPDPAAVAAGWLDPADPAAIDFTARQAAAVVPYTVVGGRPYNPAGRTGRTGRALYRWGENPAADPIVTASTPTGRHLLLIRRGDTGAWAIPGGMVEPGESPQAAALRELAEETGVTLPPATAGRLLYHGYVTDPRNSDHAWISSTALLYQLDRPLAAAGADDAIDARWWPFPDLVGLTAALHHGGGELYPPHRPLLATAHQRLTPTR